MTPRARLITVREGSSPEEARALLHEHRLERVLVINGDDELRGLVTVKDITKATEHPNASKDHLGKLKVGGAISTGPDSDERAELMVRAGVDVLIVDTAHGHHQGVLDRVRWVKKNFPDVDVVGGNIATAEGARALVDAGADGVKVGSARARSAPRASSPASACRRSPRSQTLQRHCKAQTFLWWLTVASDIRAMWRRRLRPGRTR